MIAAPIGTRSLLADLVAAGVPGAVRLDALAGDFDVDRGDPGRLRGRAPDWLADAAAVRAYEVLEVVTPAPRSTPRPRRYLVGEPSEPQRAALSAIRRMIDAGKASTITGHMVAREAKIRRDLWPDIMRGLEDRGLAEVLDGAGPPIIVLGARAHLYPERIVPRTQRSHEIERHIRAGLAPDDVCAAVTPRATRQEVLRVRAAHCGDLPALRPAVATRPTGDSHARVVAAYLGGDRNLAAIGRSCGITRTRVAEILDSARSRGEIPEERE